MYILSLQTGLMYLFILKDENKIDLGDGIANCSLWDGKIKYETFKIHEYSPTYPVNGEHAVIHKETYDDALKIVKKQNCLKDY